jgi:hypothetical protein
MRFFFRKLRGLAQRSAREADLRAELQFHLDQEGQGPAAGAGNWATSL